MPDDITGKLSKDAARELLEAWIKSRVNTYGTHNFTWPIKDAVVLYYPAPTLKNLVVIQYTVSHLIKIIYEN